VQAYQTSQYVVSRGGIFPGKWRSSFAGYSGGKMNVQSACALNTRYMQGVSECIVMPYRMHRRDHLDYKIHFAFDLLFMVHFTTVSRAIWCRLIG
jgi:hypothetical protein